MIEISYLQSPVMQFQQGVLPLLTFHPLWFYPPTRGSYNHNEVVSYFITMFHIWFPSLKGFSHYAWVVLNFIVIYEG